MLVVPCGHLAEWLGHTSPVEVEDGLFREALEVATSQHPTFPESKLHDLAVYSVLHSSRHKPKAGKEPPLAPAAPFIPLLPCDLPGVTEGMEVLRKTLIAIRAQDKQEHQRYLRGGWVQFWIKTLLLLLLLLVLCHKSFAQGKGSVIVRGVASGVVISGSARASGVFGIDCGAGTTFSANVLTCPNGAPGLTNANYAASYCQQANCTNADVVSSAFPVQVSVWTPSYCGFSIPATALGGVAPTGSSLIVEVDKNGTAIQTYALTAGQTVGTGLTVSVSCGALTAVQGDVITSKITQVGSTLPGRYVTFFASASLAGVTGAAGTNGTNGTNGSNGTNGAAGATGPNGATGTTGTAGTNGAISQIQANGTAQTVQPFLNLISGTGATVTCVNNGGATRTECTIAAAGSLSTTATLDLSMGGFNNNSAGLYPAWTITGLSGGKSPDGAIGVQLINTGTPTMSRTFRWPANWAGGAVTVLLTASAGGSSGNFGIGVKFACISGGASNAVPTYNASVLVTHIGAGINELELVASSVVTTGCSANQQGILTVYRDNTVSGNTVDGVTVSDVAVNYIIQ